MKLMKYPFEVRESDKMPDDCPVYFDFYYVANGYVHKSEFQGNIKQLKAHITRNYNETVTDIYRCDLINLKKHVDNELKEKQEKRKAIESFNSSVTAHFRKTWSEYIFDYEEEKYSIRKDARGNNKVTKFTCHKVGDSSNTGVSETPYEAFSELLNQ